MLDRNVREHDDINIKPHFSNQFDKSCYKPGKHLDARKDFIETQDVRINDATNMHQSKILNMKKSVADQSKTMHGTITAELLL